MIRRIRSMLGAEALVLVDLNRGDVVRIAGHDRLAREQGRQSAELAHASLRCAG